MKHVLEREQLVPRPRSEVFAFFADAKNLERLTPRSLHFEIRTPDSIVMKAGTLIDYRLQVHGVPIRWTSRIENWEQDERFVDLQVRHGAVVEHDGRWVLDFDDPEGQRLSLVADPSGPAPHPWEKSTVPAAHQLRGLGPIRMSVPELRPTDRILTAVMNMASVRTYALPTEGNPAVHVYRMKGEGASAELHVAVEPNLPPARLGAGGVHHVAFRTPNDEEYEAWQERLNRLGIPNSGAVDRYYFRSLYFREPGGVLFEIATDGPGFASDEPADQLGQRLALPPFLESRRQSIEAGLKPLAV